MNQLNLYNSWLLFSVPSVAEKCDALGRRIECIDSVAAATTRYYYDGPFSVVLRRMNWRVLSETNQSGNIQRSYTYGNYLDEVLIKSEDSAEIYYAHNHLYSPVALMEDDGDVFERYEYDVYGKPYFYNESFTLLDPQKSTKNNPVMFTGQRLDPLDAGDLQLMYYKNRLYCPTTGRFLQRDRVGYLDGLNLYEYCQSNPIIHIDPYGGSTKAVSTLQNEFEVILRSLIRRIENSKDPSERCVLIRKLYATIAYGAKVKENGFLEAWWGVSGPVAADFMLHWLRGSGERQFVDKDFILSDPMAKAWYDFWKKDTLYWVNTHKCDDASAVSLHEDTRGEPIKPSKELNPSLWYAVGRFFVRAVVRPDSTKKCPPCSIYIDFKFVFVDKYDWTKGDKITLFGIDIPDDYALELETCDHPHGAVKPKPFKLNTGFWESLGCVKCLK